MASRKEALARRASRVRRQIKLLVGVKRDADQAAKLIEQHAAVESVAPHDGVFRVTLTPGDHDPSELAAILVQAGHGLTRFAEEEINLETAFMQLTKGITS